MNTEQKTDRGRTDLIRASELSEEELYVRLKDSFDNLEIPDCH